MTYTIILDGTSGGVIGRTEILRAFAPFDTDSIVGYGRDDSTDDGIARWRVRHCRED